MEIYVSGAPTDVEYDDDGVDTSSEISVDVYDFILEALEEDPNELINIFTEILRKNELPLKVALFSYRKEDLLNAVTQIA